MLYAVTVTRTVGSLTAALSAVVGAWWLTGDAIDELVRTARSGRLSRPGWTLEHLVANLASALFLGAVLGLALAFTLAVAGTLATKRAPRVTAVCTWITPRVCLRLAVGCCGLGLVGPLMFASANASDGRSPTCHPACGAAAPDVGGLALPDLPDGAWQPGIRVGGSGDRGRQVGARCRQIVVRDGDSLWKIAERELPADASLGQVAALTNHLYALNHEAIGEDRDLIFAGMTLIAPEGTP